MAALATKVVHWATGPVLCCDDHAASLEHVAEVLGVHVLVEPIALNDGAECLNCANEARRGL